MLHFIIIVYIIAWVVSEAYRDAEDILEGDYIESHTSRTVNRVIVGFITACINPFYGVFTACIFWGIFDTTLNIFRKLPLTYMGGEANTDKYFYNKKGIYWMSKAVAIVTAIGILLSL